MRPTDIGCVAKGDRMDNNTDWPALDGNYIVADPTAPVAVCILTDHELLERVAALPGVAIVGTLATANLGIERLVTNVIANPAIGHLLVCGKDSPLFGPRPVAAGVGPLRHRCRSAHPLRDRLRPGPA